ncbi:cell division protein FtsQ/DivIB [Synoicihabitans lomoniglobus]|uniref:FtsQ-type POTRA domain-containing protein n=1 Tax=Synoicihabitans lomoniglobus TaxID=2909285 RepID=A0AAF0CQE7_9BACT|nr:FtsQ-type POTRA domain-containing protein [Opitutaceae bacterium LMO-M01]WED66160.1 FtsQ-type POTRA domain-containing protein [Opitutaceae bacterium LMO-M01]
MSDSPTTTPTARSWRDIPQQITPRAMSREGRRRLTARTLRNIALVVTGVSLACGSWLVWNVLQDDPNRWAAAANSRPVEHIVVETDGVLDQAWVEATLQIPRDVGLMELDLYALRERLLAHRQVKSAVLKREYPDTLRVVLEERTAVVKLKAQLAGAELRDFLVARDGTVFAGHGSLAQEQTDLPWLAGVRLVPAGDGFEPLGHIDRLADLLATARTDAPLLYADWRIVSLEHIARDGHIVVRSARVPEIIFGLREDFYTQIARLDYILDEIRGRAVAPMRSINLAIGPAQVPVAMDLPPPVSGADRGVPSVRFPLHN